MKKWIGLTRDVVIIVILVPIIFWSVPLITNQSLYWGAPALQFIPWRSLALEQLQDGIIPLWNTYNGMGTPLMANYQAAFFYPPSWILFLLGLVSGKAGIAWGFTLLLAVHGAFSALGMAVLAKRFTDNTIGLVGAGLAYSLGGYFIARAGFFPMMWVGAWFPWMLESLTHDIENGNKFWLLQKFPFASVLVISMSLLAGHAQLCWYMLIFTMGWVIVTSWINRGSQTIFTALANYGGVIAIAVLICSIQLLPTLELLIHSQRASAVSFDGGLTYSYWPWRFITIFAPDFFGNPGYGDYQGYASYWEDAFYVGILPMFLAISSLGLLFRKLKNAEIRKETRYSQFLWILVIVGFIFALGKNTPIFPFLFKYVPTFDMFNAPARYLIWSHMGLCLLAAIGTNNWKTPEGRGLYWLRLGTAGSASILITAIIASIVLPHIRDSFVRASIVFGILVVLFGLMTLLKQKFENQKMMSVWESAAMLIIILDLFGSGWLLNPTIPAKTFSSIQQISDDNNNGRVFFEPESEYSLKFSRYFRFEDYRSIYDPQTMQSGLIPNTNIFSKTEIVNNFDPLLPAHFANLIASINLMEPTEKNNWLKVMNVSGVVSADITKPEGIRIDEFGGGKRVWWFPCAFQAGNAEAALENTRRIMKLATSPDTIETVIFESESKIPQPVNCEYGEYEFEITSNLPNSIKIMINTSSDGWMLLSETWYPGWKATIDGKETNLYRGFGVFQVVKVPSGKHEILFDYQPLSFLIGAIISGFTLLIVVTIFLNFRNGKPKLQPTNSEER